MVRGPVNRLQGHNEWQCVHCHQWRPAAKIVWGTVAPEHIDIWRPECTLCRTAPPLDLELPSLMGVSNRSMGRATTPRLGTPRLGTPGSSGSPRAVTAHLSPLQQRPISPQGALSITTSTLNSRPTTAASTYPPHARAESEYAMRSDLCSRTLRGGKAVRLRELGTEGKRPRQHAFGPFCHRLPPSPMSADADALVPEWSDPSRVSTPLHHAAPSPNATMVPVPPLGSSRKSMSGPAQSPRRGHANYVIRAKPAPPMKGSEFKPKLDRVMMRKLLHETNMTRTELYRLFNRFKALCQLSGTPGSINKKNFKDGVSSLAFEDDTFVDRVFDLLDEDSSGTVEWKEFVNAVNALETGSPYDKLVFCFRVYDRDNSGSIDRSELLQMFSSMLLSKVGGGAPQKEPPSLDSASPALKELIEDFVDTIYDSFDQNRSEALELDEVLNAVNKNTHISDVWEIFGRTLVSRI